MTRWPLRSAAALLLALAGKAQAIDLAALWDFRDPALSEARFRSALQTAGADDALILQTQIARSHGLRRDFDKARELLSALQPALATAGFEARARHALEWGRSLASATHAPASQTEASRAAARSAYLQALQIARAGQLDGLAVDAIHMLAFVDTAPADQLRWAQAALDVVLASNQPAAQRWEASIRNNLGLALHDLGRHGEALVQLEQALALREQGTNALASRIARWMVARTLRLLGRFDDALALQQRLERESAAAGAPDPHVFAELELLHRSRGDVARADQYAALRQGAAR